MNWEVFTRFSPLEIQLHWATAALAFAVGLVQLVLAKGTPRHRFMGRGYAALMLVTAGAAFFVRDGQVEGWAYLTPEGMSWIHLFVLLTFVQVPLGVWGAVTGRIRMHYLHMIGSFLGGLVIAGAFTFVEGRRMHDLFFADEARMEELEGRYGQER